MSFLFFLQLGIASALAGILGIRQAFRYRLLNSNVAVLTTVLSLVAVASWLAVILWSIITIGLLKSVIVFISSFVAGNFARWIFVSSEILSEESRSKSKYHHDVASQKSEVAVNDSELKELVQRFDLNRNDFISLYKAIRRVGIEHDAALRAMMDREVVGWYFENVGKDGKFSEPIFNTPAGGPAELRYLVLTLYNHCGKRRIFGPCPSCFPTSTCVKTDRNY